MRITGDLADVVRQVCEEWEVPKEAPNALAKIKNRDFKESGRVITTRPLDREEEEVLGNTRKAVVLEATGLSTRAILVLNEALEGKDIDKLTLTKRVGVIEPRSSSVLHRSTKRPHTLLGGAHRRHPNDGRE